MANAEHLTQLNQGVKAWNTWRDKHPEIVLDFGSHCAASNVAGAAGISGATRLYGMFKDY